MTASAVKQPSWYWRRCIVTFLTLFWAPSCAIGQLSLQDKKTHFAPYLLPGELPDGQHKLLFREDWRIIGYHLDTLDFTDKVAEVSKTIYSAYSYHGHLHSLTASDAAPTMLDGRAVSTANLAGDAFSHRVLSEYNSVDAMVDVSIDNQAWYPDLGYVAATDNNRLKNILNSEGYSVVGWICWQYTLSHEARIILGHMPIPEYKSFLVDLKVTGANLVPFTLQKQNAVSTAVADLLSFAAVFSVRMVSVDQSSPGPGQDISSANVSLVVQQDASAIFVGQALTSVITDLLGTPLFDVRMAAAGLPVSAVINSITNFWDDSITDQIVVPPDGPPAMSFFQMGALLVGIGGIAASAAAFTVAMRKRQSASTAQNGQDVSSPRLLRNVQPSLESKATKAMHIDIELAGPSYRDGLVPGSQLHDEPLNPYSQYETLPLLLDQQQQQCHLSIAQRQLAFGAEGRNGQLEGSSYYPFREDSCSIQSGKLESRNCSSSNSSSDHSLSHVEFSSGQGQLHPIGSVQSSSVQEQLSSVQDLSSSSQGQLELLQGQLQSAVGQVQAWVIEPGQIEICQHPRGGLWQLGAGSFGVVYKARKGMQDVAVKTIHSHLVSAHVPVSEAADNIDRELKMWKVLSFDKNLVQFYGSCEQDGKVLLVLEYMEGGDLRHALKGLDSRAAQLQWYNKGAHIALDVIKGLHFLHSHGVLHRDIKSGNVLLSGDYSQAKICDVGLAHIMGSTSNTGQSVQATFAYAAPEMLFNYKCNENADIFSYGIVLWEIITQETPQRGTLREIQVPEECPQEVADLVDRCLQESPSARPSAQEIYDVICSTL